MIITTEAVILRGINFGDSSRILTLYTRSHGKLQAMAKAARRAGNRFGSALETMSYVTAVLYLKETRDIQLLSQCDLMRTFRGLTSDLDRMAAGMAMVELVNASTQPSDAHERLFQALVDALQAADAATKDPRNALYWFEATLLDELGFRPNLAACSSCGAMIEPSGRGEKGASISLSPDGVICQRCTAGHRQVERVSEGTLAVLRRFQEMQNPLEAATIGMTAQVEAEVSATLRRFLQVHVEGLRFLKSQAVFGSLLGG